MGTSASNNGPSGTSALLPSWYPTISPLPAGGVVQPAISDEQPNTNNNLPANQPAVIPGISDQPIPTSTGNWTRAKSALTRYTRNTPGSSIKKAAKGYVTTLGGATGATRSASSGIIAGGSFGSFLASVATQGLNATLTSFGLTSFIGRSSEEILAKIADTIAPEGATNDEAIARDAIISTLDLIYTKIDENGGDILSLQSLSPEMIKDAVIAFVSIYIFKKWIYELGIAVEKNTVSENDAIEMETEIKDFINAEVRISMQDKTIRDFDLNSSSNQATIETIFKAAYSTLQQ